MAMTSVAYILLLLLFYPIGFEMVSTTGLSDEVSALLEFRKGLKEEEGNTQGGGGGGGCLTKSWVLGNPSSTGCPQGWCGVTCDNAGNVISLILPAMSLAGQIRTGSLGRLSKLNILVLAGNLLTGNLPDDIGNLTHLAHADLSHNQLSGTIPNTIGGLVNLVNLSLASNQFEGGIPLSLSSLFFLKTLNLSRNHLNGTIPKDLAALESLTTLDLHGNSMSGGVDPSLLSLSILEVVDFSSNLLSGEIPWLQPLQPQNLKSVNLSNNQLTGVLVEDKMSVLFTELLAVLDLSSNRLGGELPSFEFLYSLQILRLSGNMFSGAIPSSLLTTMQVLEELDLSNNNLTGGIISITSTTLKFLNLSSNSLYSTVPVRLGRCMVVDISNNELFGSLSAMYQWPDSLVYLDLSVNNLSGPLPNQTARFVRLSYLNISHNSISGLVPLEFGFFPKLTVIDMSSNRLDGVLPFSFFNSSTLSSLLLSNNQFSGGLPLQTLDVSLPSAQLPQLVVLDLSNNQLNGSIPKESCSLLMLEALDLSRNHFTGVIPNDMGNLTSLTKLDLSSNQLSGSIPDTFPQSLRELNLTYNELTGVIPSSLNRFSLASFFPGNPGLHFLNPGISSNTPPLNHGGSSRRAFPLPVKVGLIGGCIAGLVLIIAVSFFLLYRKRCGAGNYKSGSECSVADKTPGLDEKGSRRLTGVLGDMAIAGGKSPQTRDPEAVAACLQNIMQEGGNSGTSLGLKMLPFEHAGSSHPVEASAGESPELLAGVLYFLDHSLAFTAEELSRAPAEVLGRSSHGTSYKATLNSGRALTVKWLKEGLAKNKDDFGREAKKFGKIRHPNIVSLRAYYWGPREHEKLILSDYIDPGSLGAHLHGQRCSPLSWAQRLRIAVDIARGLVYLHCERNMAHGNLKATNVLLDGPNLNARLGDYGLHLLMTSEGTANQILNAGALGYRAPELALLRKPQASLKADTYALGVVMMELLTGKSAGDIISGHCGAVDLTDWVRMLASEGHAFDCYDANVVGPERDIKAPKGMDDMLALALKCTSLQSSRPNIRTVYGELTSLSA